MSKIGVLALQGDFYEHLACLKQAKFDCCEVKTIADIKQTSGLIIPGGESTTIGKLLITSKLKEWIQTESKKGYPVYGTCAGSILVAKKVDSDFSLRLIDIEIQRNAYGSQLDSFEAYLESTDFEKFKGVFIRAPKIVATGKKVNVLLKHKKDPVLVRQDNILAGTFHPELSKTLAIHKYFAEMVKNYCQS